MRAIATLLLVALSACDDANAPEVPGPTVTPQAITYPDIEANGLHGASCAYASGTSMAPIVIAFANEAVMKFDGEIRRFRVDAESEGSQLGADTRYLAEDRVLLLTRAGAGTTSAEQQARSAGTVRLIDGAGAELYAADGTVQCSN
jgi:hypothetical protein